MKIGCKMFHGWHQCLPVDHHSFQDDGESACKAECHQHTLKSFLLQIPWLVSGCQAPHPAPDPPILPAVVSHMDSATSAKGLGSFEGCG